MSAVPKRSDGLIERGPAAERLGGRVVAAVIDLTVVATLAIVASLCVHLVVIFLPESVAAREPIVLFPLAGLIAGAYFVYGWGEGATLGQRMLGLRVARAESRGSVERLGLRRALLRLAGAILEFFVLDLVVALVRSDRRALHDAMAGSIVVPNPESATAHVARSLPPVRKGRKYA